MTRSPRDSIDDGPTMQEVIEFARGREGNAHEKKPPQLLPFVSAKAECKRGLGCVFYRRVVPPVALLLTVNEGSEIRLVFILFFLHSLPHTTKTHLTDCEQTDNAANIYMHTISNKDFMGFKQKIRLLYSSF